MLYLSSYQNAQAFDNSLQFFRVRYREKLAPVYIATLSSAFISHVLPNDARLRLYLSDNVRSPARASEYAYMQLPIGSWGATGSASPTAEPQIRERVLAGLHMQCVHTLPTPHVPLWQWGYLR